MNEGRGLYSLRHMDVSKLFYPSTPEALDAEAQVKKKKKNGINKVGSIGRLPRPSMYFESHTRGASSPDSLTNVFALFGESKNKILYSDANGHTTIYNTSLHSFTPMPDMHFPKGPNCMAAHITRTADHARSDFAINPTVDHEFFDENPIGDHTDSLYMMHMDQEQGSFEVLAYYPVGYWKWRVLPLPPFFDDQDYKVCSDIPYAVIDGTRICVSSDTTTYSFDTVSLKWSKTGDWVLPFHSKAEYVPELNLWIGLSASSHSNLCALDLSTSAMDSCDVVPTVQNVRFDVDLPEDWSLKSSNLVNLGGGRFCIATFFDTADGGPKTTVFTGVDVLPCGDNQQREPAVLRIKHKSKCLVTDRIQYVL